MTHSALSLTQTHLLRSKNLASLLLSESDRGSMELTDAYTKLQPYMHYLLAVLCLVVVVYKLTAFFVKQKAVIRSIEAFPGPPAHFLFGHVFEFKQDGTDLFKAVEWGKQYPYAFPIWFGPSLCFLNINHPDYAKTILTSTEPKDDFVYRFLQTWIGDGLLVSKGQKWFRHRRLLTPGFHYDVLKPYVQLMSQSAKTMLDKWESYAHTDKTFELFEHVSLMTLDTILQCAFSCKTNCQTEGGNNAYIKAVYELSDLANFRFRTFPYHSDLIFYLSPHGYRYRNACKVAHAHTENVIKKRKEALTEETELGRTQAKRYQDFLDILLFARDENQQGLSDEDLRAEVDTFMFEGHDTTASGISFLLYCLACHPEHQNICREEILQVLGGRDTMEWEDLSKIPYTTMCIKEALRLYPPVPGVARKTTKQYTFFDGRTLPVFDPLRFLPENVSKRSPHAFVPFSAGPRNCIGQTFAMNEMKVVTALTLKRYQLIEDLHFQPKMVARLILRSLNGVHIKIRPVDPQVF
uniref:aromatase n=1 Tax=Nothobranchius furzeri TaxID=105023 RepID=A0A8C6KBS5_NOTFU